MLPKNYVYYCNSCDDRFEKVVDYEGRESTDCPECGATCQRTWSGWSPNMSTRNSASMPDNVGKGRFDSLRTKQQLVKEKADARVRGDRATEKLIDREVKKI